MAKAKYVNTRIQHKYDTKDNWANATFVPLAGELIIFAPDGDTPSATTATYPRFKVGDGNKTIGNLPLLDFVADFNAPDGERGYIKNKPDIEAEVNNKISSLGLGDLAWKNRIDSTDCNFAIGYLAGKDSVSYYDLDAELKAKVDDNSGGGGGGDMYKSDYDTDDDGVVDKADYANNANNANYAISSNVADKATSLYVGVDSASQPVYVQGDSLFSEETQGSGLYYATRAIGANYALKAGHATKAETVQFGDNYYGLTSFFTTQDGSFYADRALTAKHADSANHAETADSADTADVAEGAKNYISEGGASAHIGTAIGVINGNANLALTTANAATESINSLTTRIDDLERRIMVLETR